MSSENTRGLNKLIEWFGEGFHFHDAEIVELRLRSQGPSRLQVHAWRLSRGIDSAEIQRDRNALVTFILDDVFELDLAGFSPQNVIARLDLDDIANGIRVTLAPLYGLAGIIEASRVSIEVESFEIK
jgi:hypothetical protein